MITTCFYVMPTFAPNVLMTAQALTAPISIFSKIPQILLAYRIKSTGQLSTTTAMLNIGGALARVITTITEMQGDMLILIGTASAAFLNIVIVAQIF